MSPTLAPQLRSVESTCRLLTDVGLPHELGDWFRAVEEVHLGTTENRDDGGERAAPVRRAAVLGHSPFGSVVLDLESGAVVCVDESGDTQLINSSLAAFVYFAGEWLQAIRNGFRDVRAVSARLKAADSVVLRNPEGIWSVMLEEAEAGLY